jgi:hypothetical protein
MYTCKMSLELEIAEENKKTPMHFQIIVHILEQYDTFGDFFVSWSCTQTSMLDTLTVVMKNAVAVDSVLLDLILMQYPGRLKGPILKHNSMIIHFTKNNNTSFIDEHDYIKPNKRVKYDLIDETTSDSEKLEIDEIKHVLITTIRTCNTHNAEIGDVCKGMYNDNPWISYQVLFVDSLNTSFIQELKIHKQLDKIKVNSAFSRHFANVLLSTEF